MRALPHYGKPAATSLVVTCLAACLALLVGCASTRDHSAAEHPDLILAGGNVFTADPDRPWAEAVSIRGERILAVGPDEAVRRTAGPGTRMIDLGGRVVIPGINNTHIHLGSGAPIGALIPAPFDNWVAGPDPNQVLDSLAALARRTPAGTWLSGYMGLALRNSAVRRAQLDSIAPDHPVILLATVGHGSMVNTHAMRMIGISETAPDPEGGWYERVPGSQVVTGVLDGSAQYDAWNAYYTSSPDSFTAHLRRIAGEALRYGTTTVQHMNSIFSADETERVFRAAALPIRVRIIQWPFHGRAPKWQAIRNRRPSPLSYISGVKYVVDGTPIEQWSLMRRPYEGRPGWYGRPYYSFEAVRGFLREALAGKDQLMLHITGDSATAVVFDMMRELAPESEWRPLRVRIEHGMGVTGANVDEARRLGVLITQARVNAAQIRVWTDAGIPQAFGSDHEPGNPFWEMMWQTTPEEGSQAISREETMMMYTRGSAHAEFMEREKGTLAPGMLADLAVLSQDVFTVPADALPATTSVLTLVGGRIAYDAGVLPASPR